MTNRINKPNKLTILGVGVAITSTSQVLEKIDQVVHSSLESPFFIVTVNPEFIMLAQDDSEFQHILNSADMAIPDGVGLRLAGVDTIVPGRKLVLALINNNYRSFYLGGSGDAAHQMQAKFGGESDPGETEINAPQREADILAKINKYSPDILLVAYGAPAQEKWIWNNRDRIKAKVVMGVGGTFDYLVGKAKLPPEWMSKLGLEWLWRLGHEPWRWRRQLSLLRFGLKLLS